MRVERDNQTIMEFVNIRRLKATLRSGELSSRETAKYLAAQAVLLSLLFIPSPAPEPSGWPFIAYPLVSLGGVYYCYRRNGGGIGTRFAERYLAVGWVVGWRVALIVVTAAVIALATSLVLIGTIEWLEHPLATSAVDSGSLGLVGFIYWRLGVNLSDLNAAGN